MDNNYPTLKRSKKQLTYPSSKPSLLNKWTKEKMTLNDVDQMFDDLDCPEVDDIPSPSPVLHIPIKRRLADGMNSPVSLKVVTPHKRQNCKMAANGDHAPQCQIPKTPELDIDSEIPFKAHGPVKTSSPIEEMAAQHEHREKEDNTTTPILFDVEEDAEPAEKPPKHRKDESDDSVFETLKSKFVLTKMLTQKKTQPKTISPPDTSKSKSEATSGSSEKLTESVQNPRAKHSMTAFLLKLRDVGQSKPARTDVSQAKVTPPPSEPEPEDDFLILDDDVPFYISIPSKSAKSKEKQTKSSDKDPMDSTGDGQSVDKQQSTEPENKLDGQTVNEKLKQNTTDKVSKSHSSGSDNGKDPHVLPTSEPTNTETKIGHGKTNKNKSQKKKLSSKDDNQTEDKDQGKETNNGNSVKTAKRKESKSLKNNKEKVIKKMTSTLKERRKMEKQTKAVTNTVEQERQECSGDDSTNEALATENVNTSETEPTKNTTGVNLKQNIPSSSIEGTSDEDSRVLGRRKRKPPGEWWMSCPQITAQQTTTKKPKTSNTDSSAAPSPVKATTGARKKNLIPSSSSSSSSDKRLKTENKRVKKVKSTKKEKPAETKQTEDSDEVFAEPIEDCALDRDSDSSPLLFPHRERSLSGEKVFHKVYQNSSNERLTTPEHPPSRTPEEQLNFGDSAKRRPPGNWWQVNPTHEDEEVASSQPQQPKPQKRKTAGERKKLSKDSQPTVPSRSKPPEGAPKQKKQRKSLATYQSLCNTVTVSPPISKDIEIKLKKRPLATSTSAAEVLVTEHNGVDMETEELRSVQNDANSNEPVPENMLDTFRSGPCSMIQLENFEEENEDLALPSTTVQSILGVSDLCAPPLKPLVLQPKDKDNLKEWLGILWSTKDKGAEITPDNFEWYFYQGRAIGFMVDIHSSAICSGKMLLGSFMKKPLWVDHNATTVFHLLTSSVSVIVDCKKSQYAAGQSFIVKSGHAYSVHNTSAQPAVLYFTRIYSEEESDD